MEQEKLWVSIKTTSFNKHLTICLSTACETNENIWNYIKLLNIKGILSTKIVIFSYPKLFSFSILTFIEWKINTRVMLQKIRFFDKKHPKLSIVIRIIVLDDNIQIYSYGLLCEPVLSMHTV
jgi:hypothetical protein